MNNTELQKILDEHKLWVTSMQESGSRANLRFANLHGANLPEMCITEENVG